MTNRLVSVAAALVGLATPAMSHAQSGSGSFVLRLGADTIAVESWTRAGNRIEGVLARRSPTTVLTRYVVTLNADNTIASFEQQSFRGDGTPAPNAPAPVTMTFTGDSLVRSVLQNGQPTALRSAAPKSTIPGLALSSVIWNLQLAAARRGSDVYQIGFGPQQAAPTKVDLRLIGRDSAELVAGGFRTGLKLDSRGSVKRYDGSLTTAKYIGSAERGVDVRAIAAAWAARDAAGTGLGAASTRDTARALIGGANVWIDYGRPAKRGRDIWGVLVPFDTTWRFGANAATQLQTDKDLEINGVTVPAGKYTLFLYPTRNKTELIVNSQTGQWGTAWDTSKDVVRITLDRAESFPSFEERFTIRLSGDMLTVHWDRSGYTARIREK